MSARGWWYRASREQKLAQIDGGIECGLTAREVAICSGMPQEKRHTINTFGWNHGRAFPPGGIKRGLENLHRRGSTPSVRRDYFQGERDFWNDHQKPTADVPELEFE